MCAGIGLTQIGWVVGIFCNQLGHISCPIAIVLKEPDMLLLLLWPRLTIAEARSNHRLSRVGPSVAQSGSHPNVMLCKSLERRMAQVRISLLHIV